MESLDSRNKFIKKLKGRESEFAIYTAESILMYPIVEDLEMDIAQDRLDRYSKEQLIDKLKQMNNITTDVYTTLHSWNAQNSCFGSHADWRQGAIDMYEDSIKHDIISDRFGLYNNEVEVDLEKYRCVKVFEPIDRVELAYSHIPKLDSGYASSSFVHVPDLILIRSYDDPKKFYIEINHHGPRGCLTTIDESKILAMAAKNRLLEGDKDG